MLKAKGHPNRLGIWGWLGGGRWGIERYLYTLHRVTGLGLFAYFVIHIFVTSCRALGEESWAEAMANVAGTFFVIGEYLGVRRLCLSCVQRYPTSFWWSSESVWANANRADLPYTRHPSRSSVHSRLER